MNHLRRITGPAVLMAFAVLWSNIWGQLRDSLSLSLFDEKSVAAYIPAIKVPFEAPQILSNALAAAMVPLLVDLCRRGRAADACRVARGVLTVVTLLLAPVTLAGLLCSARVLQLFHWNPADTAQIALAVRLSQVLFPYLLINGVAGVVAATLQSFEQFRPLAIGQLVPNVVIVTTILIFHGSMGIVSQALGVLLGGAAYLLVLLPWLLRIYRQENSPVEEQHPDSHPTSRSDEERAAQAPWWRLPAAVAIGRAMFPLLLIGIADWGSGQLSIIRAVSWVGQTHATTFKEFTGAYRILQIPQGIFVAALTTVLLPHLSRYAAADDGEGLGKAASAGIRMILYLVAPTVVTLSCLALPVLNVLFRHGQFSQQLANQATPLVSIMAPSVLFGSVGTVLVMTLLALKRVWALLAVQVMSLIVAAWLAQALAIRLGLTGIAAAVSLLSLINLILLFGAVERYIRIHDWQETGQFLWKLVAACAGLGVWLELLLRVCQRHGNLAGAGRNALLITGASLGVVVLYAGLSHWLQIHEWLLIKGAVTRILQGRRMGITPARRSSAGHGDEGEDESAE